MHAQQTAPGRCARSFAPQGCIGSSITNPSAHDTTISSAPLTSGQRIGLASRSSEHEVHEQLLFAPEQLLGEPPLLEVLAVAAAHVLRRALRSQIWTSSTMPLAAISNATPSFMGGPLSGLPGTRAARAPSGRRRFAGRPCARLRPSASQPGAASARRASSWRASPRRAGAGPDARGWGSGRFLAGDGRRERGAGRHRWRRTGGTGRDHPADGDPGGEHRDGAGRGLGGTGAPPPIRRAAASEPGGRLMTVRASMPDREACASPEGAVRVVAAHEGAEVAHLSGAAVGAVEGIRERTK